MTAARTMAGLAVLLHSFSPIASAQEGLPAPAHGPVDTAWVQGAVSVSMRVRPERVLTWEMVVPAAPDVVWRAWTVPAEIALWAAPAAEVDLRPGGVWEAHFFPDRPPGQRGSDANTILEVDTGNALVLSAGAPVAFPTVRREKTVFRVELTPAADGGTRVVAEQSGWREGDEWDRAFVTMAYANAEWLSWLHRRFTEGPINWPRPGFEDPTAGGS